MTVLSSRLPTVTEAELQVPNPQKEIFGFFLFGNFWIFILCIFSFFSKFFVFCTFSNFLILVFCTNISFFVNFSDFVLFCNFFIIFPRFSFFSNNFFSYFLFVVNFLFVFSLLFPFLVIIFLFRLSLLGSRRAADFASVANRHSDRMESRGKETNGHKKIQKKKMYIFYFFQRSGTFSFVFF